MQYATVGRGTQDGALQDLEDADGRFRAGRTRLVACFVINFFETRDLIGLGTFRSLDDVEFNLVAFFEALIALALNGAVMYEDVRSALTAKEAVTLCVVEPLYCALILCQWSHSLVSRLR
jgi:hypothetical protein